MRNQLVPSDDRTPTQQPLAGRRVAQHSPWTSRAAGRRRWRVGTALLTIALLAPLGAAAAAVDITNPGFEQGAAGWAIETGRAGSDAGGPNRVEFVSGGAFEGKSCARLRYESSWLWLTTSSLPGSVSGKRVSVSLRAKWLSGANLLSFGFTEFERGTRNWAYAHDLVLVAEVPKDRRWHLLEFALDVPAFDTDKRDIGLKFGCCQGTPSEMLVDAVAIPGVTAAAMPAPAPPVAETEVVAPVFLERPDIPIRSSRLGARAYVGPVYVRVPPRIEPRLGHLTPLPVTVRNRSSQAVSVSLRAHCPAGVTVSEGTLTLKPRAMREISLELRTLQPLPHEIILEADVGAERAGLSVPIEPRRAYPVFGVVEHFDRTPPGRERALRDAAMLHQMPCAAYRIDCGWGSIDPGGGKPYQFESTDWYVNLVRQTGHAPVLMMVGYTPEWANPFDDPTDEAKMGAYRRAVRAIVARYADQVDYWEAWNEPYGFWFGGDPEAYLKKGPAMLLAVQKTVWEAVRELDPTGVVLTPGLLPWYHKGEVEWRMLDRLLGMGYDQYIDAVCVHNYPGHWPPPLTPYRLDGEVRLPVEGWRGLDRAASLQDLVDLLESHHVGKPIWLSEFGGFDPGDERAQALACLRTLGVMMAQRVEGALYYELYDYPHDAHPPTLNLLRSRDLHRTLGFVAYQDMIEALTGASCDPRAATVRAPEGTESRCFTRPGETIVLLWSNRADTTTARIRWRAPVRRVTCTSWDPVREPMRGRRVTEEPEKGRAMTLRPLEFAVIVAQSGP